MKRIVFLLFLVFLAASVSAEKAAYEGWLYNGKKFMFDDVNYDVLISSNGDTLILESEFPELFAISTCHLKDYKKFCFNYSTFDPEQENYRAYVIVYILEPQIEISRAVTKNILDLGERAVFTVTLTNKGDADATNVVFFEELPELISIKDVDNAYKTGNKIEWKGTLRQKESYTIRYDIEAEGVVDQYISASVKYFDGFFNREVFSDSIRIYAASELVVSLVSGKEDYQINEDIGLTVELRNKGVENISVENLELVIPDGTEMEKKHPDFKQSNKKYRWSGNVSANTTESYGFVLSGQKTGVHFPVLQGRYKYKGSVYEIGGVKEGFVVHNEGLEVSASLDSEETVNSNQLLHVYAKAKNKNSFVKFKDVVTVLDTELASFEKTRHSQIDVNQTVFIVNTEVKVPEVSVDTAFPVIFNITYFSEANEPFGMLLEKIVLVKPFGLLEIIPSFGSQDVFEETPATVSVNLVNNGQIDLKSVFLEADVPDSFLIKGDTSARIVVNKSTPMQALSFTLIPGKVLKDTNYKIRFSASYEEGGQNYVVNTEKNVTVKPKRPGLVFWKSFSAQNSYLGEAVEVIYIIENNDIIPVHELVIEPPKSQNFDIVTGPLYKIQKVEPGEKIEFRAERMRPKKTGVLVSESSVLRFKDNYDKEFNVNSGSTSIKVSDFYAEEPLVIVRKTARKRIVKPNEVIAVSINLSNIGIKSAYGNLSGFDAVIDVPYLESVSLQNNLSFQKVGEYIIPVSVFTYEYLDNVVEAYSNEIKIIVTEDEILEDSLILEESPETIPGEEIKDAGVDPFLSYEEYQEIGFFRRIYLWIRRMMRK